MTAQNTFTLAGRLAADPEVSSGQTTRVRIRLAVDGYDHSAKAKKTDFFSITLFGRRAESIGQYAQKGSFLVVSGELRENQWTDKQGQKRYDVQLVGDDAFFGPKSAGASAPQQQDEDDGDPFGFGGGSR